MTQTLMAELCYSAPPDVDPIDIMQAALAVRPGVQLVRKEGPDGPFMVTFPDLTYTFEDGNSAALMVAVTAPQPAKPATDKPRDLAQTWAWPGGREAAADTLSTVTHTVLLAEMLGRVHSPADRVRAFRDVLGAAVKATAPVATWWPASEQAVEPADALARTLAGLVNVRMFNDANRAGYVVMDTLGMGSFGLADVQCYFRGLDLGRVAGLLYDVAAYVVDGADITDGHTVQGIEPGQKWRAYTVGSMVGPDRPVLNLTP